MVSEYHTVRQWLLHLPDGSGGLQRITASFGGASANIKLRRPSAHNNTFNCTEIDAGDMVLSHKAQNRKSSPRWRGPARVLGIDETGATVSFQDQNFKVDRCCVRKRKKTPSRRNGVGRPS